MMLGKNIPPSQKMEHSYECEQNTTKCLNKLQDKFFSTRLRCYAASARYPGCLFSSSLLILTQGVNPLDAFAAMLKGSVGSVGALAASGVRAIPFCSEASVSL